MFSPHSLKRYHLAPALLRRVGRLRFRLGCGRFHEAADLLCRAPLHIVGDVRIDVQCGGRRHMPQHGGERFHIHAVLQRQHCEGISHITESDTLAVCPLQYRLKPPAYHAGGDGAVLLHR